MSDATRESCSRRAGPSAANRPTCPISAAATMSGHSSAETIRSAPLRGGAGSSVDDLPERVLAADPAAGELEQVAPAHLDRLARRLGPADRPLGSAAVAACPVAIMLVADVRDPVE